MKPTKEFQLYPKSLVNRLYKSNNKSNPVPVNFDSETSVKERYLIPKIIRHKLKPVQASQGLRSKLFSHHDVAEELDRSNSKPILDTSLIGDHRSPAMSKVRSKIYSLLNANSERKGTGRQQYEQQRQSIMSKHKQSQQANIGSIISRRRQHGEIEGSKMSKQRQTSQEKRFLTPQDFMQILKIDREMSEQFCYMNRGAHAYDWQIVEFKKKNPQEYMVISKRGLTRYFYDEVEFLKFEQFLAEQQMFDKLSKINYFHQYSKVKHFQIWKRYTRMVNFRERSKQFNQKTILADMQLKEALMQTQRICRKMQSMDLFYCQTISAMSAQDFSLYAEGERNKTIKTVQSIQKEMLKMIQDKTKSSMMFYMKKMRISRDSSLSDRKIPLLIGDETGKDMPYTESATLRSQQLRIRNLLKLVDYLRITAKTNLLINLVTFLSTEIKNILAIYSRDSKAIVNNAWFDVHISQQDQWIVFNPSEGRFVAQVENIILATKGIICQEHSQFLHLEQFEQYWHCLNDTEKNDQIIDLKGIVDTNVQFNEKFKQFRKQVAQCFQIVKQYSKIFTKSLEFNSFISAINQIDFQMQNAQFFRDLMSRCKQQLNDLREIEGIKQLGLIAINSNSYRQKIEARCEELIVRVHQSIPYILLKRSEQLLTDIKENYDFIAVNRLNIKQYILFLRNVLKVNGFYEKTQPLIQDNSMLLTLAQAYSIRVADNIRTAIGETNGQIIGLSRRLTEIQKSANDAADSIKKQIEKLIPTYTERAKIQRQRFEEAELLKKTDNLKVKETKLRQLQTLLQCLVNQKNELQKYQAELGYTVSDYPQVDAYEEYFKFVKELFTERARWKELSSIWWIENVSLVDFSTIRVYLEELSRKLVAFQRKLEPNEALHLFRADVDTFKPLFYAVQACKKVVQDKHRTEMRELVQRMFTGKQLPYENGQLDKLFQDMTSPHYNFKYFKAWNIDKCKDEFVQIALRAQKEAKLLQIISKVQGIWKTLTFVTTSARELKEGHILGNNQELISKIDDNLMVVNNVLASKYVLPIKARVELQGRMLRYMQDLIDEWYLHQKTWIYLQPIFKSPFAIKNLPKETVIFGQIDSRWKIIMKQARDAINIKRYAEQFNSNYTLKLLRSGNESFQLIQKTLENFLEKKRDIFQRFYFLSNDELLEILSTVRLAEQIGPYLRKLFEGFADISFDQKGVPETISSPQGQKITLRNCLFRGEVEEWFKSCEESMRGTLKSIIRQGMSRYTEQGLKRSSWIKLFPSQVVLVVDAIMWTIITEGYLENPNDNDLGQWYKTNISQLTELVDIVQTELTSLERRTLVALITQDVHLRDIVESLQTCESITDFKWIQQLRFYNVNEIVTARQVQAELFYGYEYLGVATRLVITPLTERCWITITGALHIKLGANPAGPAGTGKTESCKDLAKSLGRNCLVFNCSDQINTSMMQKLFVGVAYTGSWTCLDEFNRIDIEVLSVIAQQVMCIRGALLLGKTNRDLVLGGKLIHLNHDLAIFITMNPGYAGRTELPDNLKALFRPISMMVPDYALIAEIMLFSQGFASAKELSGKMSKLYKLSSEQLSQQDHYDFGMRAVKSVLVMAGSLKRATPDLAEEIILIRAIQDSNLPKFLAHDIPIFNAIVDDLFPNAKVPKKDQKLAIKRLKDQCLAQNIIPTDPFIQKCLQFIDTLKVRFGVMLVGPPMGSKSTIVKTALDNYPIVVNPKAVSLSQLYGNFDVLTQTWTDGLASQLLRTIAISHDYIMFDGPVDAIWVENLNTVLDDSMMLCLSNGERIKLNLSLRILFEVLDLNQASPATVSRCGMIWVSEEVVPWEELINSYLLKNRLIQNEEILAFLGNLVKVSFRKGYMHIRKFAKEAVKLNASTIVHSYCKLLSTIVPLIPEEAFLTETWKRTVQKACVYAFVWSIGAILSQEGRIRFQKSLLEIFSPESLKSPIVNFGLSYKDKMEGEWVSWSLLMSQYEFPQGASYLQIYVPTKEAYCYSSIIAGLLQGFHPVYLTAAAGTGKTSLIQQLIRKQDKTGLTSTFTAQTSPAVAQIQLESKLQNQRKLGTITMIPQPGRRFVYFVDDITIPAIEEYGAQPPIEMLRLLLSSGGVWDRKTHTFKYVSGIQLIVAGSHGRNELPPRFIRFFNTLYMPEPEEDSMIVIFSEIIKGFFQHTKLKEQVRDMLNNKSILNATLSLYTMIRAQLLPTPMKSHYLFNLRDVSRVFQGITSVKASILTSPEILSRLWVHQFERVFADRLNNDEDKQFVRAQISKKIVVSLKCNLTPDSLNKLIWCNFLHNNDQKQVSYQEAKDYGKLVKIIQDYMDNDTQISLVLFEDAIAHVCRVTRALKFQKGHIMLVGLSGSGRKSMIALGSVVNRSELLTVSPHKSYKKAEFREDIYKIMQRAAFEDKQVCLLFPQDHVLEESFLEDINNLLSNGQIPCMLAKQQQQQISQRIGYQTFLKRIINNLHLGLTFSPVGSRFRSRIRNFPNLINCCYLNWISKWPEEALLSVALLKLEDKSVSKACVIAHDLIEQLSENFNMETRRKVFVTPKNYIELITLFNHLLASQKNKSNSSISKLSNGVYKLEEASAIIEDLKQKLIKMKPILQSKTVEQEQLLKKLQVDRLEAGKVKTVIEQQQRVIFDKTERAIEQKKEADHILSDALPALHAANEALNTLNRNDISQIKMNQNPHVQIKFTLECVSILLQEKEDWETVRKTISDVNFISRLKNLDVYHIPWKVQQNLKAKVNSNPSFKPNEIKQINFAAKSLCEWILAVLSFHEVNKEISKKKDVVRRLNEELALSSKQLQDKRVELDAILNKVKLLQALFIQSRDDKERIDRQIILSETRLTNASELTNGLKNQKIRWAESLIVLRAEEIYIVGNTFLSASCMNYYGPYTGRFRLMYLDSLTNKLSQLQIKTISNFDLKQFLGDPLAINDWIQHGLPKDDTSVCGAIIATRSMQHPLFIDPQLQASKWIRNLLKKEDLVQLKMNSQGLIKRVQTAVRMKYPLLIELSDQNLDASLDDLLSRQYQDANKRTYVRIADSKIQIDQTVRVYVFTKLSNPSFSPQIFIKLSVINFTVTPEGLQDQLLAEIVEHEVPEVEHKRRELVRVISKGRLTLVRNEDSILALLNSSQGYLLDDVELIRSLRESKQVDETIKVGLQQSIQKRQQVEQARQVYRPVAATGASLYLCIADLALLESMYQFSLEYFVRVFNKVLNRTNGSVTLPQRVAFLKKQLTTTFFSNVQRGLFNEHKKLFAFLLATKLSAIPKAQYDCFCRGNASISKDFHPSPRQIIPGLTTQIINSLTQLKNVFPNNIIDHFIKDKERVSQYYENPSSYFKQDIYLQEGTELTPFQQLLVCKIMIPQSTLQAMTHFIVDILGSNFINVQSSSMEDLFADTMNKIPLTFILSVGADPLQQLLRFSQQNGKKTDEIHIISLGQGQGPPALSAIEQSTKQGHWVLLQNCHLGKSFLPTLEKKLQDINQSEEIKEQFRLFLTCMPCDYFPISILQNSLKVTSEPPKGIKANLKKILTEVSWGESEEQKILAFNLCFFHALVLQRRKFGSLGWNIRYDFNQSDLETSVTLVDSLLVGSDEVPYEALEYFIGQIVYGGRVTDEFDRRLLKSLLEDFISFESIQKPRVKPGHLADYLLYVDELPDQDDSDVFGLSQNAQQCYLQQQTSEILQNMLLFEPQRTVSNENTSRTISLLTSMLNSIPSALKRSEQKKHQDAIDICLLQQSVRFNQLISHLQKSLKELLLVSKGEAISTDQLEQRFISLSRNQVPEDWEKKAYPSMKMLGSWWIDFVERTKFIRSALQEKPRSYWISAFFFPQGFLTSILQMSARKIKVAVSSLGFSFAFRHHGEKEITDNIPTDGCLVHGIYSEACTVDFKTGLLREPGPSENDNEVPVIHFKPVQVQRAEAGINSCKVPLYKTKKRAGSLSTTGHSSDYIVSITCRSEEDQCFWIKRGAAFICSSEK